MVFSSSFSSVRLSGVLGFGLFGVHGLKLFDDFAQRAWKHVVCPPSYMIKDQFIDIFVFIYIELSQIYKSIFKLNIKGNSHIVQDERKQISCESPLAWRRLDAAWMQLCL